MIDSITFLKLLVFLFAGRNNHTFIRPIYFKEYTHFPSDVIFERLSRVAGLVLRVEVAVVDDSVEHRHWVIKSHCFALREL